MTLMSRKVDYALLILSYLERKSEGACSREIADFFNLSKGFVANILKLLCQAELVDSHRGVKGGYVLARSMNQVSLAELMEVLEDEVFLAECNKSDDPCSLTPICPVRGAIAEVHSKIRQVLRDVVLTDLFPKQLEAGETQYGIELGSGIK